MDGAASASTLYSADSRRFAITSAATSARMALSILARSTSVRSLRMLSNSLSAALLASAYVLIVVLQLNPSLPLSPARLAPLAEKVGGFYALNLTAIFY